MTIATGKFHLGRRFRSLKLWFVIRHYGVEGLQYHVRQHVEMAQAFAGWVRDDNRFEVVAPVPLNLVCFRYRGSDEDNQRLMDRLNQSGDLYLTHTRLRDQFVLRFCVGPDQYHHEACRACLAAHTRRGDQASDRGEVARMVSNVVSPI